MSALRVPLRFWSLVLILALSIAARHGMPASPADGRYLATAYDLSGVTASGLYTHRHIVAADPDILPIGSIIRIRHAGRYSGEYVVADTGMKIVGRHLDIYIPSLQACKEFGVRHIDVQVLQVGKNTHHSAKEAYNEVKQDVADDLQTDTPAGAATAQDWAAADASTGRASASAGMNVDAAH